MAIVRNASPQIVTSGGAGTVKGQISLDLVQDGALDYFPQARVGLGPNMVEANSPTKLTTDAWHHLAFTADGAQLRLYVDNVLVDAQDYLGDINPADIPWLAAAQALVTDTNTPPAIPDPNGSDQFYGNMDELAIWARALTAQEIGLLYDAGRNHNPITSVVVSPPAVIPTLSVTSNANGTFTLTYTGTLLSADTVNGTYAPVSGAASPYTVNPMAVGAKPAQFFRAQQ